MGIGQENSEGTLGEFVSFHRRNLKVAYALGVLVGLGIGFFLGALVVWIFVTS